MFKKNKSKTVALDNILLHKGKKNNNKKQRKQATWHVDETEDYDTAGDILSKPVVLLLSATTGMPQ